MHIAVQPPLPETDDEDQPVFALMVRGPLPPGWRDLAKVVFTASAPVFGLWDLARAQPRLVLLAFGEDQLAELDLME